MRLASLGAVSPLGQTLKEHCQAAKQAIEKKIDFQEYIVHGKKRRVAVHRACEPTVSLPVPDAVLRRMGLSTKLVLSSIEEALGYSRVDLTNKKVGLIVGTTQGPSSTNIDYFRKLVSYNYRGASPNLFAQSVHNNIASSVALTYAWKGPTLTLVQESNLLKSALSVAQHWIESKVVDYAWLILGNEMSLHLPYIQLFEFLKQNPDAEELVPSLKDFCYEGFSSFLLSASNQEGVADFSLAPKIVSDYEKVAGRHIVKPELLGITLAEHYFKNYFMENTR